MGWDEWLDGRMDGWIDGSMDRWTENKNEIIAFRLNKALILFSSLLPKN